MFLLTCSVLITQKSTQPPLRPGWSQVAVQTVVHMYTELCLIPPCSVLFYNDIIFTCPINVLPLSFICTSLGHKLVPHLSLIGIEQCLTMLTFHTAGYEKLPEKSLHSLSLLLRPQPPLYWCNKIANWGVREALNLKRSVGLNFMLTTE